MKHVKPELTAVALAVTLILSAHSVAQSDTARLDKLQQRLAQLEQHPRSSDAAGLAAFVCAAFCALWAQQTERNAWLWFFLGLFFNVITLLVLLYKNSNDKKRQI